MPLTTITSVFAKSGGAGAYLQPGDTFASYTVPAGQRVGEYLRTVQRSGLMLGPMFEVRTATRIVYVRDTAAETRPETVSTPGTAAVPAPGSCVYARHAGTSIYKDKDRREIHARVAENAFLGKVGRVLLGGTGFPPLPSMVELTSGVFVAVADVTVGACPAPASPGAPAPAPSAPAAPVAPAAPKTPFRIPGWVWPLVIAGGAALLFPTKKRN